jgi:serine/threonine-protein kinase
MASLSDPLVLPKDLTLVPVAELPEAARAQLQADDGDVAVSRAHQRASTKIIDAASAELLRQFSTPKTMAQAVLAYSMAHGADPHATLEAAFPVLRGLINDRMLVTEGVAQDAEAEQPVKPGGAIGAWRVLRRLRHMEDTELYLAQGPQGAHAVIKIQRPNTTEAITRLLQHEAAVLRWLGGEQAPHLLEEGRLNEAGERCFLALAHVPGVDVARAAEDLRQLPDPRAALLALCVSVLDTYARLHERGLVHGDIHPGNILVDGNGQVRLLDFGLARAPDPALGLAAPYRGGVSFFVEPEYAQAGLDRKRPPDANPAGEQYGLAALLYQLLTGSHRLNFSLEREVSYRQIMNEPPLPFAAHKLAPWPAVEAVLARALARSPEARWPSVAAFAQALREAGAELSSAAALAPELPGLDPAAEGLLDEVLQRAGWQGDWMANGLTLAPTASINYGAAGLAYFLYRVACQRQDPALLPLAELWVTRALACVDDPQGFYNDRIEISQQQVGQATPYHTPSGVFAVRFLIGLAAGDMLAQTQGLAGFVHIAQRDCQQIDLALGKSGVLIIAALIHEALPDKALAKESGLLALGNSMLDQVWQHIAPHQPIGPGCELRNLGVAHGWAGMMLATLRWCEATGRKVPAELWQRLEQLAACAEPVDRGVQWVWEYGPDEPPTMSGWCNGSAGHLLLFTQAARLQDTARERERWLALAERVAWNVWEDPSQFPSLCCGLAGRGYALLALYRATGNAQWLARAQRLANQAAHNVRAYPVEESKGYEHSLYKADVGVAALIADLHAPRDAVFPFFESEYLAR